MSATTIVIKKLAKGWEVWLRDFPTKRVAGKTENEAVGKLVQTHSTILNIQIVQEIIHNK